MPKTLDFVKEPLSSGSEGNRGTGNGKKPVFLKMEAGKSYRIRPIGRIVEFYKIFRSGRSIIIEEENIDEAIKAVTERDGNTIEPSRRFAVNIIDRSDDAIKILEGGFPVFNAMSVWATEAQIHPGTRPAGDWTIKPRGEGKNRRYTTSYLKQVDLTDEEINRAKPEDKGGLGQAWNLDNVFRTCPLEKIGQWLFGDSAPSEDEGDESTTTSGTSTVEVAGSSGGDDLGF